MSDNRALTNEEKRILLNIARNAIARELAGEYNPPPDPLKFEGILAEPGASFVTLTLNGELRGCIGALEPYQSLVEDVHEHAIAAAFHDFRFPPLSEDEFKKVRIEISRLTRPQKLEYENPDDLIRRLKPGIDGVVLAYGRRRATFLPQVWEKLPDPHDFLNNLCLKMGMPGDFWARERVDVYTYQVEKFEE